MAQSTCVTLFYCGFRINKIVACSFYLRHDVTGLHIKYDRRAQAINKRALYLDAGYALHMF